MRLDLLPGLQERCKLFAQLVHRARGLRGRCNVGFLKHAQQSQIARSHQTQCGRLIAGPRTPWRASAGHFIQFLVKRLDGSEDVSLCLLLQVFEAFAQVTCLIDGWSKRKKLAVKLL